MNVPWRDPFVREAKRGKACQLRPSAIRKWTPAPGGCQTAQMRKTVALFPRTSSAAIDRHVPSGRRLSLGALSKPSPNGKYRRKEVLCGNCSCCAVPYFAGSPKEFADASAGNRKAADRLPLFYEPEFKRWRDVTVHRPPGTGSFFGSPGVLFRVRPRPKNVPVPLAAEGDSPIFAAITLVLKAGP